MREAARIQPEKGKGEIMRAKRKCLIGLLTALAFTLFGSAWFAVTDASAAEGEAPSAFTGTGKSFGADESFAFAAKAEFSTAEAAGLTFGKSEDGAYTFLVNRKENRVRLVKDGERVLKEEPFIGTAGMREDEEELVRSKTASLSSVSFQVVLDAREGENPTVSCYADGIERFVFTDGSAPAQKLELNGALGGYTGGELGYYTEAGTAAFTDETIGEDEISLYSELYRNRFHYSQNSHWNNDPNGMVYYGGYYHLYYQHNPFGETWGDMYWGHARSTDLVHWENLPVALVPDRENGEIGYMWSGSARVYHKGESAEIDGWFADRADGKENGEALGLLGYYTRHQDKGGNLNTGVMISKDGGLSWEKKKLVPCTVSRDAAGREVTDGSWRDPKVFDISQIAGEYKWGMALTDMEDQYLFLLKSKNLVDWEDAGYLRIYCSPECPDVFPIRADDGKTHTVVTLSSRYYFVSDLAYEGGKLIFKDVETGARISELEATDRRLQPMEYGPDSYAAQTFYIEGGTYAGKAVGLSWFSGMPNAEGSVDSGSFRTARKGWNGSGFTIPVVYGLKKNAGYGYTLTETPVVKDDPAFVKTEATDYASLKSHCLEIEATIENPMLEPVSIRVNVSPDGKRYTEIGWNKRDGYFVDRTHTETAGVAFPEKTLRFASRQGKRDTVLTFYILVDNGGVEVFGKDFTVPFYLLTLASPYSTGIAIDTAQTAKKEISVKEISDPRRGGETSNYLNVSATEVELDDKLAVEADVLAYAGGEAISWRVAEGDSVAVEQTAEGARIKAVKSGDSVVEVTAGGMKRTIRASVTVKSNANDDLTFAPSGVVSGEWRYTASGLTGTNWGGDGFLLSEESGSNFWYSASFDLGSGAAAAIVFRATEENGSLTRYLIANYDKPGNIVKLWSENGELGRANAGEVDPGNLTISVKAKGTDIRVFLNGVQVIRAELGNRDPLEGKFGLNACATRASFRSVEKSDFDLEYAGEGALSFQTMTARENWVVRNAGQNYRKVDSRYVSVSGRTVTVSEKYLSSLPAAKSYAFVLESGDEILTVNVAWKGGTQKGGSNVALVASLSSVFGVLAVAGATVLAVFLIRRKRAAAKFQENGERADDGADSSDEE